MSDPTTQDHHPDNPELPLGTDAATDKPAKKKALKKKRAQVATKKKRTEEPSDSSEGNVAGSISSDDASVLFHPLMHQTEQMHPLRHTKCRLALDGSRA